MTVAVSRYKTRRIAVQCLYTWALRNEKPDFARMLNDLWMPQYRDAVDLDYFSVVVEGVPAREADLAYVIRKFAPKFDVSWMPIVNVMAIYVATYEMLFFSGAPIPPNVSIDEALEVCNLFSDESGKSMVNGVLNAVKQQRDALLLEIAALAPDKKPKVFFI